MIVKITFGIVFFIGLMAIIGWFRYEPALDLTIRDPHMDNRPLGGLGDGDEEQVIIGDFFEHYSDSFVPAPGSWSGFRGDYFDNISKEKIPLVHSWSDKGPNLLWSVNLGEGHAAPAVRNGRVYVLDYIEKESADALRCFSLIDGRELWRRWYHVKVKRNHGMSRTIPAVTDNYVITIGPRCHVMCVNAISGDFLWGMDLEKNYETKTPFWYTGQCPLIDDGIAVIAPGGSALLMGLDCATGQIVWETPNEDGWGMSHSSILKARYQGRKMYVYSAIGGMVGVSADASDRGAILWKTRLWTHSVLAPSPIFIPDGRIFVTAGYGAGSMMLQLNKENGNYGVHKIQENAPKDGIASEQQTPLYFKDHLFSIQPKDAGAIRNQLVCYHPDDCTKLVWSSGKTNRFGLGPYLIADNKMFVLNDDGVLTLLEVSTKSYKQIAQTTVFGGEDAWGPMALVDGYLLLRDSRQMVCLDVSLKRKDG